MTKNGKEIVEKIKDDSKLKEEVKKCKTKEDVIKTLNQNGLKCNVDDFIDPNSNNNVSLDELKKVSGGVACVCILAGEGYYTKQTDTGWNCDCFCFGEGSGICSCFCVVGGGGEDN